MARFTSYTFEPTAGFPPDMRCVNTHTLAPLFAAYDPDTGELQTDPVLLSRVPPEHFWRNSDGYGFDVRNLSVLLRVNFRNLNPHTVGHAQPRPLWCNQQDLNTLLFWLPSAIRQNIYKRVAILDALTDETKRRLAHMAGELYSHTYTGLVAWLYQVPDNVLSGMTADKTALMHQILELAADRRTAALNGIMQHTGAQAAQHFAEPAGIERDSDLYRVLEFYKATVVQGFLNYVEQQQHARDTMIATLDERIKEYIQIQFLGLCERYRTVIGGESRHGSRMLLWHWMFKTRMSAPLRRRGFGGFLPHRTATIVLVMFHVRVFYDMKSSEYVLETNNGTTRCTDAVELWLALQALAMTNGSVHMATLAGGLYEICRGAAWRQTLKRDNALIQTMACLLVIPTPVIRYIHEYVVADYPNRSPQETFKRLLGPHRRVATGVLHVAREYFAAARANYEPVDKIVLHGGYDNGPGTLLDKLRLTLQGITCIQDVAAELCEFLSVPYAPDRQDIYGAFQVDHTNVPPL